MKKEKEEKKEGAYMKTTICVLTVFLAIVLGAVTWTSWYKIGQIRAQEDILLNLVVVDEPPDISQWHVRDEGYVDLDKDGKDDYLWQSKFYQFRGKDTPRYIEARTVYNMLDLRQGKPTLFLLQILYILDLSGREYEKKLYNEGHYGVVKMWKRSPQDNLEVWLKLQLCDDILPVYDWEISKENGKLEAVLEEIDN